MDNNPKLLVAVVKAIVRYKAVELIMSQLSGSVIDMTGFQFLKLEISNDEIVVQLHYCGLRHKNEILGMGNYQIVINLSNKGSVTSVLKLDGEDKDADITHTSAVYKIKFPINQL